MFGKSSKRIKTDNNELFKADKAVRDFAAKHKGNLSSSERNELGKLLSKRAEELSKVTGTKISSVSDD